MTRRISTDGDLVAALADLMDELAPPKTDADVDAFLRDAGYDPDDVAEHMDGFVDGLVIEIRKNASTQRLHKNKPPCRQ